MSTSIEPEYGSAAWQAERRSYLGASDMPMACGRSPYGGPLDLVRLKLGLDTVEENHAMRRGHIYEPAIMAEFAMLHPEITLEQVGTIRHPKADWLRATLDRLGTTPYGKAVVEAKLVTPHLMDHYGESGSDQVPDDKMIQVQTQLMVTGLAIGYCVVNFGFETREYVIERDREMQDAIFAIGHDLWHDHVLTGVLPEPTPMVDTMDAIQRTYTLHDDQLVTADERVAAMIREFGELKALAKETDARAEELKANLAMAIGRHYGVTLSTGERVIWPETKGRGSVNYQAIVESLKVPEEVIQQHTSRGAPYRTMRYYPATAEKKRKAA